MSETILVAVLSLLGTLAGAYFANRRSSALIAYRLEALEKKVQAHNNLVERMYAVEKRATELEKRMEGADELIREKINVANHRIADLEEFHKGG